MGGVWGHAWPHIHVINALSDTRACTTTTRCYVHEARGGQPDSWGVPRPQADAAIRQWASLLYDWRATGNSSYDVVLWANHTYTSPATELTPQLQRWAAPINLATNAFLREQLVGARGAARNMLWTQ
jgi:hypothetical protein